MPSIPKLFYLVAPLSILWDILGRQLAINRQEIQRIMANLKIAPFVDTDSPESTTLQQYLYKTLHLDVVFAKGYQKNFDRIPEISFRLEEYPDNVYYSTMATNFVVLVSNVMYLVTSIV